MNAPSAIPSSSFPVAACRPDESVFAIGDVHGQLRGLQQALDHAAALHDQGRSTRTALLGDLIDRGPDSLGCLRLVAAFRRSYPTDLLLGNHEQFMFTTLEHPDADQRDLACYNWFRNKGLWAVSLIPELGRELNDLGIGSDQWLSHVQNGNVLFVHAGVPAYATTQEVRDFLALPKLGLPMARGASHSHWAWIREGFLEEDEPWRGHFVVHGHTAAEFTGVPWSGRLNLDATKRGAVAAALIAPGEVELFTFADGGC